MPFAASITTFSGLICVEIDEGQHAQDVAGPDVLLADLSRGLSLGPKSTAMRSVADLHQARVSADRQARRARTIFIPVYSFGLCDAVTMIAAVELQLTDREIDHLGPYEADVEHVGASIGRALDDRLRHGR